MAFTAITAAQVAVDAPYTAELGQTIKDDLDYLYAQIAAPTDVSNGGFETDSDADGVPDNWTATLYTGGSGAFDTTTPYEGAQAYKFTHPGGAGNGGGYLESGYLTISEYVSPLVQFALKNSAAGTKVVCKLRYFTAGKVYISDEDIYSSVANPTTWTLKTLWGIPPATARYMKIRLIGGLDDTDVAGDVYFDAVHYDPLPKVLYDNFTIAEGNTAAGDTTERDIGNVAIKLPKGFNFALIPCSGKNSVASQQFTIRYRIATTYSNLFYEYSAGAYNLHETILNISALSGAQTLYLQMSAPAGTSYGKKEISLATYTRQ